MGSQVPQTSFTSGEIAPSLFGRVDFARYYSGLKTCLNFIVRQFGGVTNRPGTKYCATFKDSTKKGRLIPFEFNADQAYALEFTDYTIRIYKDGGLVVWPDGPSVGQPVEVTTIWPEADLPLLKYVQSADIMTICHPNYPPQQLSRTDHHLWSLGPFNNVDGPFQNINIDSSKTVYASGYSGSVTLTASSGIFTAGMVGQMIRIEQAPDSLTKKWEVQKTIAINDIRRAGSYYYQAVNAGTTGTVRPSTLEGIEADGDPGVTWQYLHSGFGIVLITGYTSATVVTGTVLRRLPDSVITGSLSRAITGVVAGTEPVAPDPGVNARVTCPAHGFSTGDSVTISGVTGMTGINVTAQIIVINANTFDLSGVYGSGSYAGGGTAIKTLTGTNTYKWALEAWGGDQGYPATVSYTGGQRLAFGASAAKPQSFWMSTVEGFTSFETSVPVLDDDAITYTLNSRKANQIRHFVELSKLIMLTSDGPFIVDGGADGLIAPGQVSAKRQSASGASHVAPLLVGSHALYIQEKGSQIRSLGYSFAEDAFIGQDLTVISSHLFAKHKVLDWAFQTVPYSVAWTVRDDGVLLALTYMPEQEVVGWHRHETDGIFESVCVITENDEDVLYLLVKRTVNGVEKRFVERMASRSYPTLKDAFFVDCGLTYDGRNSTATTMTVTGGATWDYTEELTITASSAAGVNGGSGFVAGDLGDEIVFNDDAAGLAYRFRITAVTDSTHVKAYCNKIVPVAYRATARTDWAFAHNSLSGLDHLEGKAVDILSDGNVSAQQVVTGGAITLPFPGAVVHVGLPIISDLETLSISAPSQNVRDKQKIITHVSMIVEESVGISAGPDADHLTEYKQFRDSYDAPPSEVNEIIDLRIQATWSKTGRVFVRQDKPLPITILAVIPDVSMGGA